MKSRQQSRLVKMVWRMATFFSVILVAGCTACMPTMGSAASARSNGGEGIAAGSARMAWTTFQDPFEQAFRVEVSQGWELRGGLFRMGFSGRGDVVNSVNAPQGNWWQMTVKGP